jgi:hypothetical protein
MSSNANFGAGAQLPAPPPQPPQEIERSQASELPLSRDIYLDPIEKLKGKENIRRWKDLVKRTLMMHGVQDLIDVNLSRPNRTHADHNNWKVLSQKVAMWLVLQLDKEVADDVALHPDNSMYADKTYAIILNVVQGQGMIETGDNFIRAVEIKREEFTTMEQFVKAMNAQIELANENDAVITPYMTALLFLRKVESDLPVWFESIIVNNKVHAKMKARDTMILMKESIIEVSTNNVKWQQYHQRRFLQSRMARRTNRNVKVHLQRGNLMRTGCKERFKAKAPSNGKCTHCKDGHLIITCYYLCLDLRNEG